MKIILKGKVKKYTIDLKIVKRNLLIILFIFISIKYISFMSSYNKKVLANYDNYLTQCESTGEHVNPIDYKNFTKK